MIRLPSLRARLDADPDELPLLPAVPLPDMDAWTPIPRDTS